MGPPGGKRREAVSRWFCRGLTTNHNRREDGHLAPDRAPDGYGRRRVPLSGGSRPHRRLTPLGTWAATAGTLHGALRSGHPRSGAPATGPSQ
jgi:hypothetical protein